jgi:uncharacterized protein YvpB
MFLAGACAGAILLLPLVGRQPPAGAAWPLPFARARAAQAESPTAALEVRAELPAVLPTRTPFRPAPFTSTPTITPTPTPTVTPTASPTAAALPSAVPGPAEAELPESAFISGLRGYPQAYLLSCEARSAVDWAAYFWVSISELEFLAALPASDNPEKGFVGHPSGAQGGLPPASYGVHARPVAALLRDYGLAAKARRNMRLEDLQVEISAGRPVIAWVVGNVQGGYALRYTASDGQTVTVAPYEHTVIVIGYTPEGITVLDNDWLYTRPLQVFLNSWAALENMAVILQP